MPFSPKYQQDISLACEVQLTSFEMHRKAQCELFVDWTMLAVFEADWKCVDCEDPPGSKMITSLKIQIE
jgi:hypothetical protein